MIIHKSSALCIALLLLAINATPASAAFVSMEKLTKDCNERVGDLSGGFQMCIAYISGVFDLMQEAGEIKGLKACAPRGIIVGELIEPILSFFNSISTRVKPERTGAAAAVALALANKYPCG